MFTGWFNKENIYTLPAENPRRRNIRVVYDKWITHHQVKWCCAPPTLQIWNLFAAAFRICRYLNVFIWITDIHCKCKNLVWAPPSGICTNVESIRNSMFSICGFLDVSFLSFRVQVVNWISVFMKKLFAYSLKCFVVVSFKDVTFSL